MPIKKITISFGVVALIVVVIYGVLLFTESKSATLPILSNIVNKDATNPDTESQNQEVLPQKHIPKPEHIKGIYMSSWVAGTKSFRDSLTKLVEETELNSIVIDFKDSTGVISIPAMPNDSIDRVRAGSKRAQNLEQYIKELHEKDIYTIARIAVFEDPVYAKNNPSFAVQNSYGELWKDRHGLAWVDPGYTVFHEYILDLALEAHALGFDEINLDYIRFPTDGSRDKVYPVTGQGSQQAVITNFTKFMYNELSSRGIPLSIDVFGQIVSTQDDMGIGQYYEDLLLYVDAIAPMVYPSHFYPGYKNLKSPESSPYETIRLSLTDAIRRRDAINSTTEIRPWIQDFSLSVAYDKTMVRAQIQAAQDLGLNSFLLWSPRNRYTREALLPAGIN